MTKSKNKFIYINLLMIFIVFLVGFSPQLHTQNTGITKGITAYAAPEYSEKDPLGHVTQEGYIKDTVGDMLNGSEGTLGSNVSTNVTNSFKRINSFLSSLSDSLGAIAGSLGVAMIAWTGFKYMTSSGGSLINFIKNKKEVSNALICVLFVIAIPKFVAGVVTIDIPGLLSGDDVYGSNTNITQAMVKPESAGVKFIKDNKSAYEDESTTIVMEPMTGEERSGFTGMIIDAVLYLLSNLIYAPIQLCSTLVGFVGFYPVSFDMDMYKTGAGEVAEIIGNSVNLGDNWIAELLGVGDASNVSVKISEAMAGVLANFTAIINVVYFLIKQACVLGIEVACYAYGIMHLLGKDQSNLKDFIRRFAEGLIGMLVAPLLFEFMLDVDMILSTSILGIIKMAPPGLGLLGLLPKMAVAESSFINLIFATSISIMIIFMSKSFFMRRVELSLCYMATPAIFMKHIVKENAQALPRFINQVVGTTFLTTFYAPLFVSMMLVASMGAQAPNALTQYLYYIFILFVAWVSMPIIKVLYLLLFPMGSISGISSLKELGSGLNLGKDTAMGAGKAALGLGIAGLTGGLGVAKTAASSIAQGEGVKNTFKNMGKVATNKAATKWGNYVNDSKENGFSAKAQDSIRERQGSVDRAIGLTQKYGHGKQGMAEKYAIEDATLNELHSTERNVNSFDGAQNEDDLANARREAGNADYLDNVLSGKSDLMTKVEEIDENGNASSKFVMQKRLKTNSEKDDAKRMVDCQIQLRDSHFKKYQDMKYGKNNAIRKEISSEYSVNHGPVTSLGTLASYKQDSLNNMLVCTNTGKADHIQQSAVQGVRYDAIDSVEKDIVTAMAFVNEKEGRYEELSNKDTKSLNKSETRELGKLQQKMTENKAFLSQMENTEGLNKAIDARANALQVNNADIKMADKVAGSDLKDVGLSNSVARNLSSSLGDAAGPRKNGASDKQHIESVRQQVDELIKGDRKRF